MTEGPRVNFVMHEALFEIYTWILCLSYRSKFTRGSPVFYTSMRNKQEEFNPYIYTLSKLSWL